MKKFLKWFGIIGGSLIIIGFLAFLYLIPPFTLAPPETFSKPEQETPESFANNGINEKEKLIVEHGRTLVKTIGCTGCHTPQGDKGPVWESYLSGGNMFSSKTNGAFVTRNLTPDKETGTGLRTNAELERTLRTGVLFDGRVINHRVMPWTAFTNLTDEDRYAIVMFLRSIKPVHHTIPYPNLKGTEFEDQTAIESFSVGDYSIKEK